MTGSPFQQDNLYQRKGIGTRMARELIEWARENGWQAIEACAYEDLGILYAHTGQAGKRFWEKLGFRVVNTSTEQAFVQENDFVKQMREQALEEGLDSKAVSNKYTMRLDIA